MSGEYIVYMHVTPDGKRYIGITKLTCNNRWRQGKGYKYNDMFSEAIKKHGWENIRHEVLYSGLSHEQAEEKEAALIAKYDTCNAEKGFNVCPGYRQVAESTKEKHRISSNGRKHTAETKEKLRAIRLGTRLSEKTKEKMSQKRKGVPKTDEMKRKNSVSHTGLKHSNETKKRLSEVRKGAVMGIETRKKIVNSLGGKPVLCVETGEVFISKKEAVKKKKINESSLYRCLKGVYVTAGGFHWRYAE